MLIGQGLGKRFALMSFLFYVLLFVEVYVLSFCTNVIICNTVNM